MLRSLTLLLLAALLCSFFSCKKDALPTIVKGTVVNSKTGKPIVGARVEFWIYIPKSQFPGYDQITESTITKDDGSFEYILNPSAKDISPYTVFHTDYVTKNINFETYAIELEKTTEFVIPMIPYDAALQLCIKNEIGQYNSVYIVIENPTFLSEARASWGKIIFYPLAINLNEEIIYTLPIIANEYTKIYWGFDNFISNQTPPTHQDSVFLLLNDTLNYSIIF